MPKGRKTIMKNEKLGKLEEAFALGATDREACFYANIHPSTLYDYQKRNPEFSERKRALKHQPILKARKTVLDNLDDISVAKWFLERKEPKGGAQKATHSSRELLGPVARKYLQELQRAPQQQ